MDRLTHRFLNRSTILIWFLRGAIVWVVSLPLALRAIQALEHLESAAPPAFVAFFLVLAVGKISLLLLLGRALDRVQGQKAVPSSYAAVSRSSGGSNPGSQIPDPGFRIPDPGHIHRNATSPA